MPVVLSVVGTRPNFMKVAPVLKELERRGGTFRSILVHTGQHYDDEMSRVFIEQLALEPPRHLLGVGSGSHAQQTARVMERLEPVLLDERPDLVLVPGDVNSTLAAALVASKLEIPVGHVEAGLRSFDRTMPEEINRVITDQLSDLLFTHSPEAESNLVREGVAAEKVFFVGNTMIDTLVAMRDRIDVAAVTSAHGLTPGDYVVVTLHRPALVDGPGLAEAITQLSALAEQIPIVFPAHPRTSQRCAQMGLEPQCRSLKMLAPIGYLEFLALVTAAAAVLTDSGGIQEETTYLGIPCFTLRDNTERPITTSIGTNTLLGLSPQRIGELPQLLEGARRAARQVPPLWDGQAAPRIVDVLASMPARSGRPGSTHES